MTTYPHGSDAGRGLSANVPAMNSTRDTSGNEVGFEHCRDMRQLCWTLDLLNRFIVWTPDGYRANPAALAAEGLQVPLSDRFVKTPMLGKRWAG